MRGPRLLGDPIKQRARTDGANGLLPRGPVGLRVEEAGTACRRGLGAAYPLCVALQVAVHSFFAWVILTYTMYDGIVSPIGMADL